MNDAALSVVEVSARDGLQNERVHFSTEQKIELITRSVDAGLSRVEVASFVDPRRVPQMSDAEHVVAGLPRPSGVSYIGLVVNRRGFERALAAGVDEVNFAFAATDSFNWRNQGVAVSESLSLAAELGPAAAAAGVRMTGTIGVSFGCPFEGQVPVRVVATLAAQLAQSGVDEIALADTIGVATPADVLLRTAAVRRAAGSVPLRCHFHDTRNTGVANTYAAVGAGVAATDASLGGLGGCPFAPGATGNVATEDVLYLLEGMGVATGVDPASLLESVGWLEAQLGRASSGALGRAGWFPSLPDPAASTSERTGDATLTANRAISGRP